MEVTQINPVFEDDRGAIADILCQEVIDSVTVISSQKGVVRGNHYHKETIQWVYLQSGKLESHTALTDEESVVKVVHPGDLIRTDKNEHHALKALEDSVFFVFTRGPRGGSDYESDTYRLDTPLIRED